MMQVTVKAQFLVDGQTSESLRFLDETVRVPHFDDCAIKDEEEKVGRIAVGKRVEKN